ncbi:DUF1840 domain-containing protein [Ottowia thiooxydans]|uniref:DUF1840 domain-containing protein n=1 Tax=Ottowia thiooxydans TaxID=219182 RepID=UPI00040E245E|nr:DUF1840 domain-containing protein [Ottowia thiooxydans]
MLYKFKSQAAAEVIMLRETGDELLKIIGKTPGATGIITVAQIPDAIAALQAEVKRRAAQPAPKQENESQEDATPADDPISLGRRVVPFIDLLRQSAQEGKDVVWGV